MTGKRLTAKVEKEVREHLAAIKAGEQTERPSRQSVVQMLAEIDYLREQNQAAQVYATQLKQRIKGLGG